jgi:L-methionine (R)-S-oxide reductase
VSNCANASALIYHGLAPRGQTHVNWVGVYVRASADEALVLGPFQGEVACVAIPPGKGVCGTAAKRRATVVRTHPP